MRHLCGQHVGGSLKESLGLAFCLHFTWESTERFNFKHPSCNNIEKKQKVSWVPPYFCVWEAPEYQAWCSWSGSDSSCWANFWWEWHQLLSLISYTIVAYTITLTKTVPAVPQQNLPKAACWAGNRAGRQTVTGHQDLKRWRETLLLIEKREVKALNLKQQKQYSKLFI